MKTFGDAKVGQRVRYKGKWAAIGECKGVITKLFPLWPDDCPCLIGYATVKVDKPLPEHWPYTGDDFAPSLNELEIINEPI